MFTQCGKKSPFLLIHLVQQIHLCALIEDIIIHTRPCYRGHLSVHLTKTCSRTSYLLLFSFTPRCLRFSLAAPVRYHFCVSAMTHGVLISNYLLRTSSVSQYQKHICESTEEDICSPTSISLLGKDQHNACPFSPRSVQFQRALIEPKVCLTCYLFHHSTLERRVIFVASSAFQGTHLWSLRM